MKHITYFKKRKHPFRKSKPKYSNRSSECLKKHWHQSAFEATVCNRLFAMEQAGEIKKYETQKKFSLDVKKVHITNHYVDFFVTNNDGSEKIVEAKGYATGEWKIKHNLCLALYPKIPYEVVVERGFRNSRIKSLKGLKVLSS